LAGGSNYITGSLPTANQVAQSITGITGDATFTGTTASGTMKVTGLDGYSILPLPATDGYLNYNPTSGTMQWSAISGGGGTITLTGDVTGSGTSSIATTVAAIDGYTLPNPGNHSGYLNSSGGTLSWIGALIGPVTMSQTGIKTASYSIASTDYLIYCATAGGAFNLQLPNPTTYSKQVWVIKNTDGYFEANPVTLLQYASEKIENIAASRTLTTNYGSYTITNDGTNWWLLD
jgi:hypothetical protein